MSQKSSVPQAISFVSQVLKRDTLGPSWILVDLRGVGSYPIDRLIFGSKALNPALVALVIPDDHMPIGSLLVWEGLHDRLFVRIHHESNMRPWPTGFQRRHGLSCSN